MLPADLPCLSLSRTSVSDVHLAFLEKKKSAASSAMIHFSLKRMGQVMGVPSSARTLHVPRGSLALSLVQLGTLLLKGQSFFARCLTASSDILLGVKPKTSVRGCVGAIVDGECSIGVLILFR